ncbi:HD domain-containing protein [Actinomycetospora sp. NBRC 106378]|uniref:HD domain-containing protein n=1 Tax=Actinomycetospora sp. NBRC 106378 TaxID=3032208 RepID=UPI0024A55164|nr:HD domain-containing protein [Actinomycetospora sp. NBRC 106378]GLZ51506.1 metal-dependent phosphohydrolase, HD subdomain protein [Actinomycetospora sp. NBRC 106378]
MTVQERPGPAAAADLARELLAPLGARWTHTQQVARRADELSAAVPEQDRDLLVVAAWFHDLGYAPGLVQTGFHPIDGARYLAARGHSPRLCALVAHHSAATFEAEERDLADELAEWPREEGPVPDALWTADMTTGPRGQSFDYADRLAEILARFEPDSIVGRAMTRARPDIAAATERTTSRLAAPA